MAVAFPGESAEYRAARNRLVDQEIELRRVMEAVAEARRRLPPGGVVPHDYVFQAQGRETAGWPAAQGPRRRRAAVGAGQECDSVRVTYRRLSTRPIAWGMGRWQYHGSYRHIGPGAFAQGSMGGSRRTA